MSSTTLGTLELSAVGRMPDFGPDVAFVSCLVPGPGALLRITHPGTGAPTMAGTLSLELHEQP